MTDNAKAPEVLGPGAPLNFMSVSASAAASPAAKKAKRE